MRDKGWANVLFARFEGEPSDFATRFDKDGLGVNKASSVRSMPSNRASYSSSAGGCSTGPAVGLESKGSGDGLKLSSKAKSRRKGDAKRLMAKRTQGKRRIVDHNG